MKRWLRSIVCVVLCGTILSCSDAVPPIKDYHSFLKSDETTVNLESDLLFSMMLYGSVASYDDDLVLFGHKQMSRIYAYRLSTDSLQLLDSSSFGRSLGYSLTASASDSVWYIHHVRYADGRLVGAICNMVSGCCYYPKSTLPLYGDKYTLKAGWNLPVVNGHIFTKILSTDTALHLVTLEENSAFNHRPKLAEWQIVGDSLELVRMLCCFPEDYAATEYGDCLCEPTYNPVDSLFILPAVDGRLWLFDLEGKALGERRLGSQLEQPMSPFPITEGSYNNALNWYANNNSYGRVIFDPYRNVYLRVMSIPPVTDDDALERPDDKTWVLVVADRDFNVKYEVQYDDYQYEWRLILPTREGVYIAKKKGDKYEKPSLFVFD